jgi:hypothetical protein
MNGSVSFPQTYLAIHSPAAAVAERKIELNLRIGTITESGTFYNACCLYGLGDKALKTQIKCCHSRQTGHLEKYDTSVEFAAVIFRVLDFNLQCDQLQNSGGKRFSEYGWTIAKNPFPSGGEKAAWEQLNHERHFAIWVVMTSAPKTLA